MLFGELFLWAEMHITKYMGENDMLVNDMIKISIQNFHTELRGGFFMKNKRLCSIEKNNLKNQMASVNLKIFLMFVVIVAMMCAGIAIYMNGDMAKAAKKYTQTLENGSVITWSYTLATDDVNCPATDVYLNVQEITGDIIAPEYFPELDENGNEIGKHYIESIGKHTISGQDSFFYECEVSPVVKIDFSACSKLTTIHNYSFYWQSYVVVVPSSLKYVGKDAFYGCSSMGIYCENPNILFNTEDSNYAIGIKWIGPSGAYSTAYDFYGSSKYTSSYSYTVSGTKTTISNDYSTFRFILDWNAGEDDSNLGLAKNTLFNDYVYVFDDYEQFGDNAGDYTTLSDISVPQRKGYVFDGYYTDNTFDVQIYDQDGKLKTSGIPSISDADNDGEVTLTAKWTPYRYNISYELNGGNFTDSALQPLYYDYGKGASLPESDSVKKKGYIFKGWYSDNECSGDRKTSFASDEYYEVNASTVTVYAKWEPITYTIKFIGGNALGSVGSVTCTYDVSTELPDSTGFTYTGYHFMGWSDNEEAKEKNYDASRSNWRR